MPLGWLESSPFVARLGIRLEEMEPDRVRLGMPFNEALTTLGDADAVSGRFEELDIAEAGRGHGRFQILRGFTEFREREPAVGLPDAARGLDRVILVDSRTDLVDEPREAGIVGGREDRRGEKGRQEGPQFQARCLLLSDHSATAPSTSDSSIY